LLRGRPKLANPLSFFGRSEWNAVRDLQARPAKTDGEGVVSRTPRLLLALLLAAPAAAQSGDDAAIYRWTDERGGVHFTEEIREVPAAQRREALNRIRAGLPSRLQTYGAPARFPAAPAEAAAAPLGARPGYAASQVLRIPFVQSGTLMLVQVRLNDEVEAPFLVDTGASGISVPDAVVRRLGIRIDAGTPRISVQTAAGIVAEPLIELDSVQVGPARIERVAALVNSSMEVGLLGGAFFNNFVYQVDAAEGVITLRPNENVRGGLSEDQWRERFRTAELEVERLERYAGEQTDESPRGAELARNLQGLRDALEDLHREANTAGVPRSWRE
jgi:clan AA aspartic protease (TIGR02281 family)